MLTKSSAANVTASESLARSAESRTPEAVVSTWSATIAPFAANRMGATSTPSAYTSNPVWPKGETVKTGAALRPEHKQMAASKAAWNQIRKFECFELRFSMRSYLNYKPAGRGNSIKIPTRVHVVAYVGIVIVEHAARSIRKPIGIVEVAGTVLAKHDFPQRG